MIIETIFNNIIAHAEEVLAADEKLLFVKDTRTDQQKALDRFFSTRRFCEYHDSIKELVVILTGYEPAPVAAAVDAVQFRIVYCTKNQRPWIILSKEKGFGCLEQTQYCVQAGCERRATPEEARTFIDQFKTCDPGQFIVWCRKNLDDNWWMLNL